jgi:Ca-activated chloride channel family protein
VFQASIGNLPPGKEVTVKLTYVTELPVEEGRLRFVIPTTVSPRYAPAENHTGAGRPDAEALNPPVAWRVPYGLNLSVHVEMPRGMIAVESPSHPIAIRMNEDGATVALSQNDAALDRDFILSIDAPGLDSPQALVERSDDGTEAIGVAFAPAFDVSSAPAEVIFVVDRSGSMGGDSIDEVRNALQLCLRSLTPGCRFNIVGFGSSHEALFPETRSYDQASLEIASAHVAAMQADLGGTEILPALSFVLDGERSSDLPRQVVVLTDGEVSNTDAVIALGAAHAASARIFTFGIGAGASHHLVRGLARAGGGSAEFIYPGERIEPKVLRQLARLLAPALTEVRVEWTGGTVTQAPMKIPAVFAGGRLLVYGFVRDGRPANVRLTATGPSGTLSFEVPLAGVPVSSSRTVATLAARARLRELEEGDWAAARGSRQKDRKATSVTNEIIALSVKYGLLSRETSFVAVERRDTPVQGDVKLRRIPIALTTGWGGLRDQVMARPLRLAMWSASPSVAFGGGDSDGEQVSYSRTVNHVMRDPHVPPADPSMLYELADAASASSKRPRGARRAAASDRMHELIVLQSADGSWELTPHLASIVGRDLAELRFAVDDLTGPREAILRVWATALAIAWLIENAIGVQDEWHLLADKGRRWIDNTTRVSPVHRTWIDEARNFLRS